MSASSQFFPFILGTRIGVLEIIRARRINGVDRRTRKRQKQNKTKQKQTKKTETCKKPKSRKLPWFE